MALAGSMDRGCFAANQVAVRSTQNGLLKCTFQQTSGGDEQYKFKMSQCRMRVCMTIKSPTVTAINAHLFFADEHPDLMGPTDEERDSSFQAGHTIV
jgi:hypothetical protein